MTVWAVVDGESFVGCAPAGGRHSIVEGVAAQRYWRDPLCGAQFCSVRDAERQRPKILR